jgi:hypothetical protein
MMTIVAFVVHARMAACASKLSTIVSGSGPSSRIDPREHVRRLRHGQGVHDPVRDPPAPNELRDRAGLLHLVDRAHVEGVPARVAAAVGLHAERRAVQRRLDVVDADRVPREHRVREAVVDHPLHRLAAAGVDERRADHPQDVPALPAVFEEPLEDRVVVDRLLAADLGGHERERLGVRDVLLFREPAVPHEDALAPVLRRGDRDEIALLDEAELLHLEPLRRGRPHEVRVHPRALGHAPLPATFTYVGKLVVDMNPSGSVVSAGAGSNRHSGAFLSAGALKSGCLYGMRTVYLRRQAMNGRSRSTKSGTETRMATIDRMSTAPRYHPSGTNGRTSCMIAAW